MFIQRNRKKNVPYREKSTFHQHSAPCPQTDENRSKNKRTILPTAPQTPYKCLDRMKLRTKINCSAGKLSKKLETHYPMDFSPDVLTKYLQLKETI